MGEKTTDTSKNCNFSKYQFRVTHNSLAFFSTTDIDDSDFWSDINKNNHRAACSNNHK